MCKVLAQRSDFWKMSRTEADEQKAVIQWCILMEERWPELEYIYHVPNGDRRGANQPKSPGSQAGSAGSGTAGGKGSIHRIAHRAQAWQEHRLPGAETLAQDPQEDGPLRSGLL